MLCSYSDTKQILGLWAVPRHWTFNIQDTSSAVVVAAGMKCRHINSICLAGLLCIQIRGGFVYVYIRLPWWLDFKFFLFLLHTTLVQWNSNQERIEEQKSRGKQREAVSYMIIVKRGALAWLLLLHSVENVEFRWNLELRGNVGGSRSIRTWLFGSFEYS